MVYTSFNKRIMNEGISISIAELDTSNVSDNVEEATSNLIYESEINWNSLMQAVGIAELAAMESTGEVIYEAVDFKAFFGKVKEFFKGLLEKIGKLFKKIVETVQNWFNSIKKTFYDNKFKNLTSVPEGFTYEGYYFKTAPDKMVHLGYDKWLTNHSGYIDELEGYNLDYFPDYETDESIDEVKERIAILNDQNVKKAVIDDMRSYLLNSPVHDDYDWNKEIFSYFRYDKEKPQTITAKDIDIAYYKDFVATLYPNFLKIAKDSYKSVEKSVNHAIYRYTTVSNTAKYFKKANQEIGNTKSVEFESSTLQLMQIQIKYVQEFLNSATSVHSGLLKAMADQAKQYYGALVKMLQMSKSSNNSEKSENNKTTNEDFDMTHSLLDNVNFI